MEDHQDKSVLQTLIDARDEAKAELQSSGKLLTLGGNMADTLKALGLQDLVKPPDSSALVSGIKSPDKVFSPSVLAGVETFLKTIRDESSYGPKDVFLSSGLKSFGEQLGATSDSFERIHRSIMGIYQTEAKQIETAFTNINQLIISDKKLITNVSIQIEQDRRMREACKILEIDPNAPDEYYDDMDIRQFWNEVAAVRWLKQTAARGHMQSAEVVIKLSELLKSGQISGYTLGRFTHLLTGQPDQRTITKAVGEQSSIVTAPYPMTPPTPDNAGWDAVFDWFYRIPRWVCPGLRELSEAIAYHYGTTRTEHSKYKMQYGERPIPKNDTGFF